LSAKAARSTSRFPDAAAEVPRPSWFELTRASRGRRERNAEEIEAAWTTRSERDEQVLAGPGGVHDAEDVFAGRSHHPLEARPSRSLLDAARRVSRRGYPARHRASPVRCALPFKRYRHDFPKRGRLSQGAGFRRFVMKRYPFRLVYANCQRRLPVLAVAATKRRPGYWRPSLTATSVLWAPLRKDAQRKGSDDSTDRIRPSVDRFEREGS